MNFTAPVSSLQSSSLRQFPTDDLDRHWLEEREKAKDCAKFWVRKCRDALTYEELERCQRWLGVAVFEHHSFNKLIWARKREVRTWI